MEIVNTAVPVPAAGAAGILTVLAAGWAGRRIIKISKRDTPNWNGALCGLSIAAGIIVFSAAGAALETMLR